MTIAASQAGDADSSRTPSLNSNAHASINDHGVRYYLYHNESVSAIQYLILAVKPFQERLSPKNFEEEWVEIWRSRMTKIPKRQTMHRWNNAKPLRIRSITQLLRTDLGRSAGGTTVIQPVCLTWGVRAKPSHFSQSPCNENKNVQQILMVTLIERGWNRKTLFQIRDAI